MYVYLAYRINVNKRCYKQHARKILKYFDNSCLVETKMKNHDRMKAAYTYYSIHLYTFIASYKNVRLKRELERLQIHIRVNYMENVMI